MLSEPSYRQLRFEGRPQGRPSAGAAVVVAAPTAISGQPRVRREEPPLAAEERRLVESALATAGLDAGAYRAGPMRRRLPAVLRTLRTPSAIAAERRLAGDRTLATRALDALLIGHTEPFRDAEAFAELRQRVLPTLAAGGRGLRVWSVGCSGGLELLSVALLLAELGVVAGSTLRGSDCRASAIAAAKSHALEKLPAVSPEHGQFEAALAAPEFLAAVEQVDWCVEDALVAPARGLWDLVLCRNLAIYLSEAAARQLWTRLAAALAPGGVLVTGKAEQPPADLPLTRLAKCIYRLEGSAP